jgi:hypothetical protein
MTRQYKLARLHKNILLGVSGVALASTMMLGGAQTATTTATSTATSTPAAIKYLNKADKAQYNLCKKNAKSEQLKAKSDAEKKYFEAFKALKDKRSLDLKATRTATTSTTTLKIINKERQALRLAIERKYQADLRNLKDIRHDERVKADENYDKMVCRLVEDEKNDDRRDERGDEKRKEKEDDKRNERDNDKRNGRNDD